jgi:hypothetical protein
MHDSTLSGSGTCDVESPGAAQAPVMLRRQGAAQAPLMLRRQGAAQAPVM